MSQKALFERLGAPLKNVRWSWGAVRAKDGAVFLRVWQDETLRRGTSTFMRLTSNEHFQTTNPTDLGYQERQKHVAVVSAGARCYMIMCVAMDTTAEPRVVESFNSHEVWLGGDLIDVDGDTWLELKNRVGISDAQC